MVEVERFFILYRGNPQQATALSMGRSVRDGKRQPSASDRAITDGEEASTASGQMLTVGCQEHHGLSQVVLKRTRLNDETAVAPTSLVFSSGRQMGGESYRLYWLRGRLSGS